MATATRMASARRRSWLPRYFFTAVFLAAGLALPFQLEWHGLFEVLLIYVLATAGLCLDCLVQRRPLFRDALPHYPLITLSALFLIPFLWLLTTSFKPEGQMMSYPPVWFFTPTLEHYVKAFTEAQFKYRTFLANSLLICEFVVLGTILSSAFVAYGLSRIRWRGRDFVFICMLATMMLPGQVTMIPVFMIFMKLGWINSFLPLIVPAFLGNTFFIFMLRQFFLTIPQDLQDAARIDGCNELMIWWRVVLPLSKPALATVGLFAFLGSWNDFMGPLIYIYDERLYTMSLGLAMFQGQYGTEYGQLMAVSTILTIPIIILFFFTQRTFIQGIKLTGQTG